MFQTSFLKTFLFSLFISFINEKLMILIPFFYREKTAFLAHGPITHETWPYIYIYIYIYIYKNIQVWI